MGVFEKSDWIWCNDDAGADEYGEFVDTFRCDSETVRIRISCDGDYALWINGAFVESNQYGDFEHYKIYDTIDISALCHPGENEFSVTVRYEGCNSATHIDDGAGVIFAVRSGDTVLAVSGAHTKGSLDDRYLQHQTRNGT